jgi:hypothetical protein
MKRWQLPTQKGTELWPRTTVQPPKLVIEGVETGTPLYRAVAEHYGGQLKQFHGKAQQDYALSAVDRMRRHAEWTGARATYVNQGGNETLTLRVDAGVLSKVKESIVDWWDYALIELLIPDAISDIIGFTCYAHMASPIEAVLTDTSTMPFLGVASITTNQSVPDPILNAANSAPTIAHLDVIANERAASFTVDLRPMRGGAAVTELYPYLQGRNEFIPSAGIGWGETTFLIYSEIGNPVSPDVEPPFPSAPLIDPPLTAYPLPTVHFDRDAGQWVFDINGSNQYIQDSGYLWSGDDAITREHVFRSTNTGFFPGTVGISAYADQQTDAANAFLLR